ncbi:MAG: ribosome-associated translation inhibitor RaiA [Parachlamydiaceae bacterium]
MNRKSKSAEFVDEGYRIAVTGHNVMVTESMKDYVIEKVSKIEKFTHRIIDVTILMDVQKHEHRVDIVLKLDHVKIKSQAVSDDMYASIDKAVRRIETQLLRYKAKLQDHQAKASSTIDMNVNVLKSASEQELVDVNLDIEDENRRRLMDKYYPHTIVRKDVRPLKILTDGEAMMKMELSQDDFLIYQGEEDRKLKVIYRRKDGNFGVIEPQA